MKLDTDNILKITALTSELELEQVSSYYLRVKRLAREDSSLQPIVTHLYTLIEEYEEANWQDEKSISDEQIEESNKAEHLVNYENQFYAKRKEIILNELQKHKLKQQDLAKFLNHRKNYMSELMNGVRPFSQKDMAIIHRLLKIDYDYLFPPLIKKDVVIHINQVVKELNLPHFKIKSSDLNVDFEIA